MVEVQSGGVWQQEALVSFHGNPLLTDLQSTLWRHVQTHTRLQPAYKEIKCTGWGASKLLGLIGTHEQMNTWTRTVMHDVC